MADRTLCDTTKLSKRLSLATPTSFGLYPYIFQETCDYGRLDTNPYLIKAQRFPLIKWVTPELIEKAIQEYNSPQIAILFLWEFDGHRYGYFVNFEARSGKHLSRRRKSPIPEPPTDILSKWLQDNNRFKTVQTVQNCSYKLSQVKLSKDASKEAQSGKEKISHIEEKIFKPMQPDPKNVDWDSPFQVWGFYHPEEKNPFPYVQSLIQELRKVFDLDTARKKLALFMKEICEDTKALDHKAVLETRCKAPGDYLRDAK